MRTAMIGVLSAALLCPLMVGCGDKEVSHSEDQSHNPLTGNTTTTDKTTYRAVMAPPTPTRISRPLQVTDLSVHF